MRDRLIELLKKTVYRYQYQDPAEAVADYLLDNGVIVPPVKVGDTVYIIDDGDEGAEPYVLDVKINSIGRDRCGIWITMDLPLGFKKGWYIGEGDVGKRVFLTREEAERALKGDKDINVLIKTEKGGSVE